MTQDTEDVVALIENLRQLRVILKSGDYDGADLMRAWCAMSDAADRLQSLSDRIDVLEEALNAIIDGSARRHVKWSGMLAHDIARAALHQEGIATDVGR